MVVNYLDGQYVADYLAKWLKAESGSTMAKWFLYEKNISRALNIVYRFAHYFEIYGFFMRPTQYFFVKL